MKIIADNFKIVEVRPKKKFYYLGETWAVVPYPCEVGNRVFTINKVVHFDTGTTIPLSANGGEPLKNFIIRAENTLNVIFKRVGAEEFKAEINKHTKIN